MVYSYSIILPYINEINSLKKTISIIRSDNIDTTFEFIIIVSDKLTTSEDLDKLEDLKKNFIKEKISIFFQKQPYVGGAIKKGIDVASNTHLVIMASDLETDPHDLKEMLVLSKNNPVKIICGNRWHNKDQENFQGYGFLKKYLNLIFQFLTSHLYRVQFADFTFAYRIYPAEILKNETFKENRHSFALEMILKPILNGYQILSCHCNWTEREEGVSQNNIINYFHYFKILIKLRFNL